jgi:hypothetical protein
MSEIKQARLIDGDKLLEWLCSDQFDSPHVYRIINAIKEGEFAPSDQGVAARLREVLENIKFESDVPVPDIALIKRLCDEALSSSHTEDTGIQTGIKDKNGKELLGGHHCEVYIDGESPNDGFGKAVVKWSQERKCWMFDFYAGLNGERILKSLLRTLITLILRSSPYQALTLRDRADRSGGVDTLSATKAIRFVSFSQHKSKYSK